MRGGKVSLNTLIVIEVSSVAVLVAVLFLVLPLLREGETRPGAGTAGPAAAAPPIMARSPLPPDGTSSARPIARLRWHRCMKALKTVPKDEPGMASLSSIRVKTESRRKNTPAPDAPPPRAKRTPLADLPI